ncbi:unnamed protein product, partial [marine sediment metagenome]
HKTDKYIYPLIGKKHIKHIKHIVEVGQISIYLMKKKNY